MKLRIIFLLVALVITPVVLQAKTLKIATVSPDGLSWIKQLRAGVKEIKKRTEGRVKFKIYPGGVQGDDKTVLRKIKIGQLHGGAVSYSSMLRFYPDLQVYALPLAFNSYEEVDYVRQRMDDKLLKGLADNGKFAFPFVETGFAHILSNRPIKTVADLQSVKAWIPDGDEIAADIFRSFEVNPIPLSLADVLAGLQTGLVDTVAIPPIVALSLQWHNHVKYVTEMPLVYIYSMLMLDSKALRGISADDRAIMEEVLSQVFRNIDKENRDSNVSTYNALLNQGIKPVTPSKEDLDVWHSYSERSIKGIVSSGKVSKGIVEELNGYLSTTRGETVSLR